MIVGNLKLGANKNMEDLPQLGRPCLLVRRGSDGVLRRFPGRVGSVPIGHIGPDTDGLPLGVPVKVAGERVEAGRLTYNRRYLLSQPKRKKVLRADS